MRELFQRYIDSFSIPFPTGVAFGLLFLFCLGTVVLLAVLGRRGLKWTAALLLVEYIILILVLAVFARPVQAERMHDFALFWSYRVIPKDELMLPQIIMNVAVFIPVGVLLGCAFEKMSWWKAVLAGGALSVLIEALQFVTRRGFAELDDVFHNTIGCLIGFGVFAVLAWTVRRFLQPPDSRCGWSTKCSPPSL